MEGIGDFRLAEGPRYDVRTRTLYLVDVNDLQDKPEGLDVSVLPIGSVSGLPVAPHPYG